MRTMQVVKKWLTGTLGHHQPKQRLQTHHNFLNFFNHLHHANTAILTDLKEKGEAELPPPSWYIRVRTWFLQTVDDTETAFYYWSMVVTIACLYNLMTIPFTIYKEFQDQYYGYWLVGGWLTDAINVIDVFVQSKRQFLSEGVQTKDPKLTLKKYVKSRRVIFDLLALLPLDVSFIFYPHFAFTRLNRLFKTPRIYDYLGRTEIRTNFPHLFRLVRLLSICLVIFHWNGCLYFMMSIFYGYEDATLNDWVFSFDKILDVQYPDCDARFTKNNCSVEETYHEFLHRSDRVHELTAFFGNRTRTIHFNTLIKKYELSFYWSALTLTTLGEQASPTLMSQTMYEIIDTLIGLIVFAVIVGDVGDMVTSANQTRAHFEERLDGCKRYMNFRRVPRLLVDKILRWFEYVWKEGATNVDEDDLQACLPPRLYGELAVHIHMATLCKVALFDGCEAGLLYELVLKLQLQIYSTGDYVCRKGDIGKELYIIKKGQLQVVSEDGTKVFVTLEEGKVFGELSVLNIAGNKNGNRRTASIRSVGYSDLYVLTKQDLWEVLREYPDATKRLVEKGKEILRKDKLLDESVSETDESDDDSAPIEYRLSRISRTLDRRERQINEVRAEIRDGEQKLKRSIAKLEKEYVYKRAKARLNRHRGRKVTA